VPPARLAVVTTVLLAGPIVLAVVVIGVVLAGIHGRPVLSAVFVTVLALPFVSLPCALSTLVVVLPLALALGPIFALPLVLLLGLLVT
jgi:hypothetical protein